MPSVPAATRRSPSRTAATRWAGRSPLVSEIDLRPWSTSLAARFSSMQGCFGTRSKIVMAGFIHKESLRDEAGRVVAEVENEVKYALGSGTRGVSFLVEHEGRLLQSPIAWYEQKKRWDLSPGYPQRNRHFDREIEPQCLFCHANQVEPIELTVNHYKEPIFRGHSIGCERCHGPGGLHVRAQELLGDQDVTIVNPRHLEPALREAVCEQCHLQGDYRIERRAAPRLIIDPGSP